MRLARGALTSHEGVDESFSSPRLTQQLRSEAKEQRNPPGGYRSHGQRGNAAERRLQYDVLFDCVLSSAALGAVLDVLRLAWWCALMVRPGGNVRQLAANVVYRASAVDIRGRRCSSAAAGGRERWVR